MVQNSDGVSARWISTRAQSKKFFISIWAIAIVAGLLQSIAERFYIEPDRVNYLDVAHA